MTDQDDIREKPGTWMGDSSDKEDTENHDEDRHEEQTHWRWRNLDKMKMEKNAENCWHKTTNKPHWRKQEFEKHRIE